MSLHILQGGLQTTLQDGGRPQSGQAGMRHLGVPQSGAADKLSMAIANNLVSNPLQSLAIEMTMTGATLRIDCDVSFALAGAPAHITLNDRPIALNETHTALAGDSLSVGAITQGARTYLAFAATIESQEFLGSSATYLPAQIGGHYGRALKTGDTLNLLTPRLAPKQKADKRLIKQFSNSHVLRTVRGPHFKSLIEYSQNQLFTQRFQAGHRANRMGIALEENTLTLKEAVSLDSFAVFPGTIQCPPSGQPFLLLMDAQTTGGYHAIARVIQADLHLTGQIKPGDTIRFYETSPQEAQNILLKKEALLHACFHTT